MRPATERVRRHGFRQGRVRHVMPADADDFRLLVRRLDQPMDRGVAEHGSEVAVERARRAAALDVAEDRHASVLAETIFEHGLDVIGGHRLAVDVAHALGDEHDAGTAADAAAGAQHVAHRRLPIRAGRALRDQDEVGTRRQAAHQGEVAAVSAHHLDDERALVARRRALQSVDRLGDAVQRRVGTDRHVRAEHVVVDRADETDHREIVVGVGPCPVDRTLGDELVEQLGPFGAELGGPAEAAITADHDERVDVALDEVAGGAPSALASPEVGAAGCPQNRPALVQDPPDIRRRHRTDAIAAVDQALQALVDTEHLESGGEAAADDRSNCRVHAGGVAAAGEHCELAGDRRHTETLPHRKGRQCLDGRATRTAPR